MAIVPWVIIMSTTMKIVDTKIIHRKGKFWTSQAFEYFKETTNLGHEILSSYHHHQPTTTINHQSLTHLRCCCWWCGPWRGWPRWRGASSVAACTRPHPARGPCWPARDLCRSGRTSVPDAWRQTGCICWWLCGLLANTLTTHQIACVCLLTRECRWNMGHDIVKWI